MRAAKAAAGAGLRLWNAKRTPPPIPRSILFRAASSATTTTMNSPRISDLSIRGDSNVLSSRSLHSTVVNADCASELSAETTTESFSPEVQRIHQELIETMNKQRIPQSALVSSLLQQCSNRADVKLALEVIARLRTTRAVQGQQQANFSPKLSKLVLDACLRVDDPQNALKTIWAHNIYGFTPSLEAAHQILAYAREKNDISLMRNALKTMVSNSLVPTRTTADIVLRTCKDQGNESLLFSLAKEFHENGLEFRPPLYDVCISSAANAGDVKHVMEIQQWRSKFKLPQTTASTFALSKAHLLNGRPKDAAKLICSQVQESEERDMYLRVLVRAWPVEVLSRRKRSVKEENLKTGIGALLKELKSLGCSVGTDVAQEFGTGKETVRKVVYGTGDCLSKDRTVICRNDRLEMVSFSSFRAPIVLRLKWLLHVGMPWHVTCPLPVKVGTALSYKCFIKHKTAKSSSARQTRGCPFPDINVEGKQAMFSYKDTVTEMNLDSLMTSTNFQVVDSEVALE